MKLFWVLPFFVLFFALSSAAMNGKHYSGYIYNDTSKKVIIFIHTGFSKGWKEIFSQQTIFFYQTDKISTKKNDYATKEQIEICWSLNNNNIPVDDTGKIFLIYTHDSNNLCVKPILTYQISDSHDLSNRYTPNPLPSDSHLNELYQRLQFGSFIPKTLSDFGSYQWVIQHDNRAHFCRHTFPNNPSDPFVIAYKEDLSFLPNNRRELIQHFVKILHQHVPADLIYTLLNYIDLRSIYR